MPNLLEKLLAKLRERVANVPLREVGQAKFSQKLDEDFDTTALELKFTAAAATELAIVVLNEARDDDDDRVFGAQLEFDEPHAWLKYQLRGTLTGSAAIPGILANAIQSKKEMAVAHYRIHDAATNFWSALDYDRGDIRTILDRDAVRDLRPREALTLRVGGEVTASVRFSWSDALTSTINGLTSLLPEGVPIAIKLGASAGISARVRVSDEFLVILSRTAEGRLRVTLRKAQSRGRTLRFTAELEAGADATADLQRAIDAGFDAIVGRTMEEVEGLLAKLDGTPLDPDDTALLQFLLKRFDLENAAKREAELRKRVGKIKGELEGRLRKAATIKAELGFAYEYNRIDERTAIADYLLAGDEQLDEDYTPAIHGDFATLTKRLADPNGRELLRYLNERTITRKESLGFTLGIGKWSVKIEDKSVLEKTVRENLSRELMINYKGVRSYDEPRIEDNDFTWTIDLAASMDRYAAKPVTSDFTFGLHYLATFRRAKLAERDVRRIVDFAILWNVCNADSRDDVFEKLSSAIGTETTARVQLLFRHPELVNTVKGAPKSDAVGWSSALGAAMPYDSMFEQRTTVDSRRSIYAKIWKHWLANDLGIAEWKATIRENVPFEMHALDLTRDNPRSMLWFLTGGYPKLRASLASFTKGLQLLDLIASDKKGHEPEEIGRTYDLLQPFWRQRISIAASGAYLLNRAKKAGAYEKVERTLALVSGGKTITIATR